MGNCLRHDNPEVQWGGEDWTPAMMTETEKSAMKNNIKDDEYCSVPKIIKEVKVKITKKQLEELLGRMDVDVDVQQQGLTTGQLLGQLVKVSVHCETTNHKCWKPRLMSIPEV